jgi:hypothetical protein
LSNRFDQDDQDSNGCAVAQNLWVLRHRVPKSINFT